MKKSKIALLSFLCLASVLLLSSCEALNESSVTEDTPLFAPERWAMAGAVTLEGLAVVFSALAILFGVTSLFGVIFGKKSKKAAEKKTKELSAPDVAPAVEEPADEDDGELVAVITAAVAAYIDSDTELSQEFESGFRVVSFRRTGRK